MALRHDHRGDLWIGTLDAGLARLSAATGAFKHYRSDPKQPEGLSANGVTAIFEDRDGRLWLGTYGGGLDRFDPETERFTHFRHDPDEPAEPERRPRLEPSPRPPDGRLWVGTMEKGPQPARPPAPAASSASQHRPGDPRSLPVGRGPRPLRRRGGQPLGGHAQRPQPPARRTASPSRPSARATACPATSSTASAATARAGCG